MSVEIEKAIETGLRAAIRAALDSADATAGRPVDTFWLEREELPEPVDQSSVVLICAPYQPAGWRSAAGVFPAGKCPLTVKCVVNPGDADSKALLLALWGKVTPIVYSGTNGFTPSVGVTLSGVVVTGTDAGTDERGAYLSLTADVFVQL